MSVGGLSSLFVSQNAQSNRQEFQQEFQQLGKDLQSGNLSAAQSDFATLQQLEPQSSTNASGQSTNPIAQAFEQLSEDLQAGNLAAAQQDYSTIQQDFQTQASQMMESHHPHHHSGGNEIGQLMNQLGQALQSGNLSTAQQVYNTLMQDFQKYSQNNSGAQSSSSSGSVSVSA